MASDKVVYLENLIKDFTPIARLEVREVGLTTSAAPVRASLTCQNLSTPAQLAKSSPSVCCINSVPTLSKYERSLMTLPVRDQIRRWPTPGLSPHGQRGIGSRTFFSVTT